MVRRANQPSQAKQNSHQSTPPQQTFLEHIYELRARLFWIVLTLVVTTGIGLEIKDQLIAVIMAPLRGGKLVYLTPGGGFNFIFTLCLYFGVLLTIPVITYQIYGFLKPILVHTSRRFIFGFICMSTLLAVGGAALAYFLAIPGALGFLNGFAGSSIVPDLTADSYLRFVVAYIVGMAALFQLPLLLFLFDHIKPIPPGFLAKSQRYGIVATTILAALITPSPDLMNYAIVLLPLLSAYELGVFAVWMRRKLFRSKKAKAAQQIAPKTVPESEPITDEAPLTAIIEEIANEEGRPQSLESVQMYQPQSISAVRPVANPAQLTPSPSRQRSIDGMRVASRYRTNVHVPPRQQSNVTLVKKDDEQSADGLLTVQA